MNASCDVESLIISVNPCPFCDHDDVEFSEVEPGTYAIDCPECQCIGPFADSTEEAAQKWNKSGQQERTRAAVLTEMCQSHEREIENLRRWLDEKEHLIRALQASDASARECLKIANDELSMISESVYLT